MPKFARKITPLLLAAAFALVPAVLRAEAPVALATGTLANFVFLEAPAPAPEVSFVDGDGKALGLADFRGKLVLLNLWATWCGPCRREMADLDKLQAKYGGPRFEVLALSGDRQGPVVVPPYFEQNDIEHLKVYNDKTMASHRALRARGLPTTLLIDPEGRELGRLVGPAEWSAPEAEALIEYYLARFADG